MWEDSDQKDRTVSWRANHLVECPLSQSQRVLVGSRLQYDSNWTDSVEQPACSEDMRAVERSESLVEEPVRFEDMVVVERNQSPVGQPVRMENMEILQSHGRDHSILRDSFRSCHGHLARDMMKTADVVQHQDWDSGSTDQIEPTGSSVSMGTNWNCRMDYLVVKGSHTSFELHIGESRTKVDIGLQMERQIHLVEG